MGIPLYFKTISSNFPETIISNLEQINENGLHNFLFFDLNCLIHPCCRTILKNYSQKNMSKDVLETRMLTEIILSMEKIIEITKSRNIYIAIDGVAPFSKMNQQRQRRYKSMLEKQIDRDICEKIKTKNGGNNSNNISNSNSNPHSQDNTIWDTNAISPGTKFMKKLKERISTTIKTTNFGENIDNVIFSSSDEPGEGEHKILQYIKNNTINDNIVIYGLDADLIMLSMSSGLNNIYLLREAVEFGKIIPDKYLYLDIDHLKYGLILTIKDQIYEFDNCYQFDNKIIDNIIDDYIFICYFLGNDFVPHMPGLDLKNGGHDIIMEIYVSILVNYGDFMVNRKRMKVNYKFLLGLLSKLTQREKKLLQNLNNSRNRLRMPRCDSDNQFDIHKHYVNFLPITDKKNKEKEKIINIGKGYFKSNYYKLCFDFETREEIDELCRNYFEGIKWVFFYYFDKCASWSWKYNYRHAPLLSDLFLFLNRYNINDMKLTLSKPLHPLQQLMYILPKNSRILLPNCFYGIFNNNYFYPSQYDVDMLYCRYFWQTVPILPDIGYDDLKRMSLSQNSMKTMINDKR